MIRSLFSTKSDLRARAKLDLQSKLKDRLRNDVVADGAKVLEIVCAEAMLSQEDILNLIFPKGDRTEDGYCLHCDRTVNFGRALYHVKCPVTK